MNTGKKWSEDLETKAHVAVAIGRFMDIYFHEQSEDPLPLLPLSGINHGWNSAEQVAQYMGLRSKAREQMEAFFQTPEGKRVLEQIGKAEAEDMKSTSAKP